MTGAEREQADVSRRHYEVRDVVSKGLHIEHDFLTGSYKRWTKNRPLQDVDVFCVLHADEEGYRQSHPSAILERLQAVLTPAYAAGRVTVDRMAVTVSFGVAVNENDETDDKVMSIDVVPAFAKADHYEIPDALHGTWIETNPEIHVDDRRSLIHVVIGDVIQSVISGVIHPVIG